MRTLRSVLLFALAGFALIALPVACSDADAPTGSAVDAPSRSTTKPPSEPLNLDPAPAMQSDTTCKDGVLIGGGGRSCDTDGQP